MSINIYGQRLAALRERMAQNGIDAYIIVTDDFHASEYVDDYFKCREYVSGFTGSAGTLVVTADEAGLWTDGRYFLQAGEQLKGTGIALMKMMEDGVPAIEEYLGDVLQEGECIGYCGKTINAGYARTLKETLAKKKIKYREDVDLVGDIWQDRPPFPTHNVWELDIKYAGKSRADKLGEIREELLEKGADCHLLTSLDDIAWLYNLRGSDIAYTPVAMSHTIITNKQAILYIAPQAVSGQIKQSLECDGVEIRPYMQVYEDVKELADNTVLMVNPSTTNVELMSRIPSKVKLLECENPTLYAKSIKNNIEISNERKAHIQDGVAVTKLLYWLKNIVNTEEYKSGKITEMAVAEKLLEFRRQWDDFVDQSFAPIVATGGHGAIVHYEITKESDVTIEHDNFLLMDTGAHYLCGTTDITRTVAMGEVSDYMKKCYTAVLRGNINLAAAKFRKGCKGANLDCLARSPLWEMGLDYNHGTGHGVGYLMNVHEGPQNIGLRGMAAFEEGMLTSDEPGLYVDGKFGIRLENLMLCINKEETDYGRFMGFDTITMVPFDRESIVPSEMTEREKELVNNYHKTVYDAISPFLNEKEKEWLLKQTKEL